MALKQTIEATELLGSAFVTAEEVAALLEERAVKATVTKTEFEGGSTQVLKAFLPGTHGRSAGREAPTLGVIGTLGGLGARPARIGLVSDADGAITAVATALKLADMTRAGDQPVGDVIVSTHITPRAPIRPHDPVPYMMSPVPLSLLMRQVIDSAMDAVLSVDTTRGNRIVNARGIAITPTAKEGYVLRVSEELLDLLTVVTGRPPVVLPVTLQDITPYANELYHLNSIMQPATVTDAPVVGVALISEAVVPGSATGASQPADIEQAVRFCVEVAKAFGENRCRFYDLEEFERLVRLYGSMRHFQVVPEAHSPRR